MARNRNWLNPVSILICVLALSGCAGSAKKSDLMAMRAQAAQAYAQGDWGRAEKLFLQLTKRASGESEFWFRLGNIYARTQRPELAIKAYQEALVRQNSDPKAWHNMGMVYLRQAGNAFTQLLTSLKPDDPLYARAMQVNETILMLLSGETAAKTPSTETAE
jgi:Flp pilus assembly protein TadD